MGKKYLAKGAEQATNELAESTEASDESSQLFFVNAVSVDMAFHISSVLTVQLEKHLHRYEIPVFAPTVTTKEFAS